ncbi:YdcF family protein [Bacillus salitolerans]|uniref:YdcF family protein n=1 Tax=Bacillus salitolerans TaxID=1437434 RepID=A0ABW4LQL6_9BACI
MKMVSRLLIVIFSMLVAFICYTGYSIITFSEVNETIKTDAAIVLGAAIWEDKPSPVFRERINHAISLYHNGTVEKLIFTGGKGEGERYAESEIALKYAIENKVNPEDIHIETVSKITEENLLYAKQIIIENKYNNVLIISDPLHMKRSMLIAKDLEIEAYSSPTPSSVYKSWKSKAPFFFRELFYFIGYIVVMPFR